MRQRDGRHALHVFRRHEVALVQHRRGPRQLEQREHPARRGPDLDAAVGAGGARQVDAILGNRLADVHLFQGALHLQQLLVGYDRFQGHVVLLALLAPQEDLQFLLRIGVADAGTHDEAVQLRFGQRVGALELHRILGGDDDERRSERKAGALHGDLPLLHRLQQGGLGLRRGAVDLVAEQQVGEQRPAPELELRLPLVVDVAAGDLSRKQVGRELDAAELDVEHRGEGVRDQRLGQSGIVLDQDVAVRQDAHEDLPEHRVLADDHLAHGIDDLSRPVAHLR